MKKVTFRFELSGASDSLGDRYIYLLVQIAGKRKRVSTGQKIFPAYWSQELNDLKHIPKNNYKANHGDLFPGLSKADVEQVKDRIHRFRENARKIVAALDLAGGNYSVADIVSRLRKKQVSHSSKDYRQNFVSFVERMIEDNESRQGHLRKAPNTIKAYKTILQDLKDFSELDGDDPIFGNIDKAFLQRFYAYLVSDRAAKKQNQRRTNHDNAAYKKVVTTKGFLSIAQCDDQKNGYGYGITVDTDYYKFKVPKGTFKPSQKVALKRDELAKLVTYQPTTARKRLSLDIFLIACFTGLRASEIHALNRDNVNMVERRLHVVEKKTGELRDSNFNEVVAAIFTRYAERPELLPIFHEQKVNADLKEICKECGITDPFITTVRKNRESSQRKYEKWQKVSLHTGRRTYVTLLAMDHQATTVQSLVGHSNLATTERYFHNDRGDLKKAYDLTFGNWEGFSTDGGK